MLHVRRKSYCGDGIYVHTSDQSTGTPVWVAWTLRDDESATLRGGEALSTALQALQGIERVKGVLVNCCAPKVWVFLFVQVVQKC